MNKSGSLWIAALLVLLLAGPAQAQNTTQMLYQLQADIVNLRNQVTLFQNSVDQRHGVLLSMVERLVDQMNLMTANVQTINETVGRVQTSNESAVTELRTIVGNLSRNMDLVNDGLTAIRTQLNSLSQNQTSRPAAQSLETPEGMLASAAQDYRGGYYDLAIMGFQDFLHVYPAHPEAPNAQFQLGESYYSQGKFEQAIIEYDLLLQKYPNADRTAAALYKKGLALAELNQIQQAIETLRRIGVQFPGSQEAALANQKITELNARAL